ncbi:CsiV family protein [Alteromonas macleodii]|uniref:Peptidoglycan-binding protein n=1 Tax=Alteromonas macleodii TaxID=28108 RepID=A0A6T9Y2C8_ALTMA|nr:CsiV family protein [Alteromonas macleodii]CAB9493567.1 conserved exported protein of unknown function [Alteromonas macleodii]
MKLSRWCPLVASISAVFLTTISTTAYANDNWWFDVEVIAFKRNVALTELEEQFSLADNLNAPRAQADIISDVIAPDISYLKQGLAVCGKASTIKWPNETLFDIPSKDVDFLSLSTQESEQSANSYTDVPSSSNTNDAGSAYNNTTGHAANANKQANDAYTSNQGNLAYSSAGYTENLGYVNEEVAGNAPDATTIASYWTSFFGVKQTTPVTVPKFKYCEEAKPWLSAEITTVLNVVASTESDVNNEAMTSAISNKTGVIQSALKPAIVWKVNKPDNRMPAPASLPIVVEGHDWPLASKAHLLTSEQQALSSISRQIRSNRQLERLFHATWRQPVMFGKNNAFDVRLYGGQNYSQQFDLNGDMLEQESHTALVESANTQTEFGYDATANLNSDESNANSLGTSQAASPLTDSAAANEFSLNESSATAQSVTEIATTSDIFADIDRRLSNPQAIKYEAFKALDTAIIVEQGDDNALDPSLRTPIWEIDGTIKVFLKYINRVPYLHVDGEMFYRQPVPLSYFSSEESNAASADQATPTEYKLVSVPLAEQRRVISTQLHYFDHPLFGFVVQVRRYNRPNISE